MLLSDFSWWTRSVRQNAFDFPLPLAEEMGRRHHQHASGAVDETGADRSAGLAGRHFSDDQRAAMLLEHEGRGRRDIRLRRPERFLELIQDGLRRDPVLGSEDGPEL
jgi:hypothetical protein